MKKSAKAFLSAKTFLCAAVTALLLAGCVVDQQRVGPIGPEEPDGPGDVTVTLNLRTPGGFAPPVTRALTSGDENHLEDARMLVFEEGGKLLSIKEIEITQQPNANHGVGFGEGEFTVDMQATESKLKLVAIANMNGLDDVIESTIGDVINSIADPGDLDGLDLTENLVNADQALGLLLLHGATYDEVVEALQFAVNKYLWNEGDTSDPGNVIEPTFPTLPMWGETTVEGIEEGTNIEIDMLRAVARIDVGVGRPSGGGVDSDGNPVGNNHGEWTWDGMKSDGTTILFKLASVHVVRSSSRWAVIPDDAKTAESEPTIPAYTVENLGEESEIEAAVDAALAYHNVVPTADYPGGLYLTREIYIPEAEVDNFVGEHGNPNYTKRPALVVGGYYNSSSTETFYRIDFQNSAGLFDVLRNHLYQFNITGVSGPGKGTIGEAYHAEAMNMTVDVLDWDEDNTDVEWIGQKFFSFSKRPVVFNALAGQQTVTLRTNIDEGFTMTLGEDKIISPITNNTPVYDQNEVGTDFDYTLTLTGVASGVYTYKLVIVATDNFGPGMSQKIDDWTIVVGDNRITTKFKVEQEASETDPGPFTITMKTAPGGTAVSSHQKAEAGDEVWLMATPNPKNSFVEWIITAKDGGDLVSFVPSLDLTAGTLTFPMPDCDIIVTPVWDVYFDPLPATAPYIIYIDKIEGDPVMRLGKWGDKIDFTNIAYFKFGSVVGTYNPNGYLGASFDSDDIGYNPILDASYHTIADWDSIPFYTSEHGDGNASDTKPDVTVESGYITENNLKWGKGDPCRLIGLPQSEARALAEQGKLSTYKSGFRLPTPLENYTFIGYLSIPSGAPDPSHKYSNDDYPYWGVASGQSGGFFPVNTTDSSGGVNTAGYFLPAVSRRLKSSSGEISSVKAGYYWSSTSMQNDLTQAYCLYVNGTEATPATFGYNADGHTIRCVPESDPTDGGFSGELGGWKDKDVENEL